MLRFLWVASLSLLAVASSAQAPALPDVDPVFRDALVAYQSQHRQAPEEYIVAKFDRHDVVLVGERHRIKQNVELIARLVPLLHARGVRILCTEFARREDQPMIDRLLRRSAYDEALAREIAFRAMPFWGYQEYLDIFRAAWRLNRSLPKGARPFRILALNDSPDWSIVKTRADRDDLTIKRRLWRGGGEHKWAKVVLDEVVAKGEKALVFSGIHHAFSEYQQPIVDETTRTFRRFETTRMGNYIFRAIGKRAITVYLHAPWPSRGGYGEPAVLPGDGMLDAAMAELGPGFYPFGMDTRGTPLERVTGRTGLYSWGYDDFTIGQFADGWVFQCPIGDYTGVTPIARWVNESNLARARRQSPNPDFRSASAAQLNEAIAEDADIPSLFAPFRQVRPAGGPPIEPSPSARQ